MPVEVSRALPGETRARLRCAISGRVGKRFDVVDHCRPPEIADRSPGRAGARAGARACPSSDSISAVPSPQM